MNDIENALSTSWGRPRFFKGLRGSLDDFVPALRVLGASFSTRDWPRVSRDRSRPDIHPVFLSCAREIWQWVFGTPANVADHQTRGAKRPFQSWSCQCDDGEVLCLGHLFQHASRGAWVVLVRIVLMPSHALITDDATLALADDRCGDRVRARYPR